jgi:hypothetical protein
MSNHLYILDDNNNVIPEPDTLKWGMWFEKSRKQRIVAQETIGDSYVSTVFLGLDHNWEPSGSPVLWETLVFGGPMDEEMDRCSGSREQAEAMHARMIQRVKEKLGKA